MEHRWTGPTFENRDDVPDSEAAAADVLAQRTFQEEHGQSGEHGRYEVRHQEGT